MKHLKELVQKIEEGWLHAEEDDWIAFSLTSKEAGQILSWLKMEIEALQTDVQADAKCRCEFCDKTNGHLTGCPNS